MKHLQIFTPTSTEEIANIINSLNVFYANESGTIHTKKERIVTPKQRHQRNKHHKGLYS